MSGRFQRGLGSFAEQRRWKQHVPYATATVSPNAPPFDTGNLVWGFDPDQVGAAQFIAGPAGTITTPVKTAGPPAFYTYGAADRIDFGNALEAVWAAVTPKYTLYAAINPAAGDLAPAVVPVLSKDDGATAREWVFYLGAGKPAFAAFAANNGSSAFVSRVASGTISAARHVLSITVDGSQSVQSRAVIYVDGSAVGMAADTAGTPVTPPTTAASLRAGQGVGTLAGPAIGSYVYAYSGVHSAGTVASIAGWIQSTKGWT